MNEEKVFNREEFMRTIQTHDLFAKHINNDGVCSVCGKYLTHSRYNASSWRKGVTRKELGGYSKEHIETLLDYYMIKRETFNALRLVDSNVCLPTSSILKYHTDLKFIAEHKIKKRDVAWLSLLRSGELLSINNTICEMAKHNPQVAYRLLFQLPTLSTGQKSLLFNALKKQYGTTYMKRTRAIPNELKKYLDKDLAYKIITKNNMQQIPIEMAESSLMFIAVWLKMGGKCTEKMVDMAIAKDQIKAITYNIKEYNQMVVDKLEAANEIRELFDYVNTTLSSVNKSIDVYKKHRTKDTLPLFYALFKKLSTTTVKDRSEDIIDIFDVEGAEEEIYDELRYNDLLYKELGVVQNDRLTEILSRNPKIAKELCSQRKMMPCMLNSILTDSEASSSFLIHMKEIKSNKEYLIKNKLFKKLKEVVLKDPQCALELGRTIERFDSKIFEVLQCSYENKRKYLEYIGGLASKRK